VVSFDNLDHRWLIKFVEHRVAAPRILRLIQKWLKAGVMEEGKWSEVQTGSPQGSGTSLGVTARQSEVCCDEGSSLFAYLRPTNATKHAE
jgi:retron-type reverse transcriptase